MREINTAAGAGRALPTPVNQPVDPSLPLGLPPPWFVGRSALQWALLAALGIVAVAYYAMPSRPLEAAPLNHWVQLSEQSRLTLE